jgi:chaperone required for assembly of F1-ATPase
MENEQAGSGNALVPADAFDADLVDSARGAVASGLMSDVEIARHYNLSPRELEAAKKPARSKLGIEAELKALRKLRVADPKKYFSDDQQARERELIEQQQKAQADRVKTGEQKHLADPREWLAPALVDEWDATGGIEHSLATAQRTALAALEALEGDEQTALRGSFDALPAAVQTEVIRFLAIEPASWRAADKTALDAFAETEDGAHLIEEWGADAGKRLGILRGRIGMMLKGLTETERAAAADWLDGLSTSQAVAVLSALAGR